MTMIIATAHRNSILLLQVISLLLLSSASSFLTSSSIPRRLNSPAPYTSIVREPQQPRGCNRSSPIIQHNQKNSDIPNRPESETEEGIRLNKVFKRTHSRREADTLIGSGRVTVNGEDVASKGGFKVMPFEDVIKLDGRVVKGWEEMNGFVDRGRESKKTKDHLEENVYEYIKYWKPKGVTCTTDLKIHSNIIKAIKHDGFVPKNRVYPVGRLDRETTGLIILTSDGRLPNSVLRGAKKQPKTYEVFLDRRIKKNDILQLEKGVIITTVAQRDGKKAAPRTERTLPCTVEQMDDYSVRMTIVEGRNRQIRKMMDALDYEVMTLHRVHFMGISLSPLRGPGEWEQLGKQEMKLVQEALKNDK